MGELQGTVLSAEKEGGACAGNGEALSSIWKLLAKFSQNFHALQDNLLVMSFPTLPMIYFSFFNYFSFHT